MKALNGFKLIIVFIIRLIFAVYIYIISTAPTSTIYFPITLFVALHYTRIWCFNWKCIYFQLQSHPLLLIHLLSLWKAAFMSVCQQVSLLVQNDVLNFCLIGTKEKGFHCAMTWIHCLTLPSSPQMLHFVWTLLLFCFSTMSFLWYAAFLTVSLAYFHAYIWQ